jgi:hypothetical protein
MSQYTLNLDTRRSFRGSRRIDRAYVWGKTLSASLEVAAYYAQRRSVPVDVSRLTPQAAEKLMHMIRVLEQAPLPGTFNLARFQVVNSCGTTACACGWAALDPWFQAQAGTVGCVGFNKYLDFVYWLDLPRGLPGHSADLAERLFIPSSYPRGERTTPRRVADRIRVILNAAGYTGKHTLAY